MDLKERLARLNEVLKHRSLVAADLPSMKEPKRRKGQPAAPGPHRTRGIDLWIPMLKSGARLRGLAVPSGEETPTQEQFRVLMQRHLEGIFLSNPAQFQEDIEQFADMWATPELDAMQLSFPPAEWPAQLVRCVEFDRTLEKVGWDYRNPPQRPWEYPCTLRQFLATVWAETPPL